MILEHFFDRCGTLPGLKGPSLTFFFNQTFTDIFNYGMIRHDLKINWTLRGGLTKKKGKNWKKFPEQERTPAAK